MTWILPAPPPPRPWRPERALSLKALRGLEGCALRGAIGHQLGPTAAALVAAAPGTAKHDAVRRILAHLTPDRTLGSALRAAGGGRQVALEAVEAELARVAEQLRVPADLPAQLRRERLATWVEEIADHAVFLLAEMGPLPPSSGVSTSAHERTYAEPTVEAALADGTWRAHPDVVVVRGDRVRLIELKTGRQELDLHALRAQLELYAAVWSSARGGRVFELLGLHPTRGVVYQEELGAEALEAARGSLESRGARARRRGEALVTQEGPHCASCHARAGCERYWRRERPAGRQRQPFGDLQIRLRRTSDVAADGTLGVVERSPTHPAWTGRAVHLRSSSAPDDLLEPASPSVIRVLGAKLGSTDQGDLTADLQCPSGAYGRSVGSEVWSLASQSATTQGGQ